MSTISRAQCGVTHEVLNQPPPLVDYNAFEADVALRETVIREGGAWGLERLRDFGAVVASGEALDHARRAQRNIPVLKTHDRYGNRIDEVEYDPSMHWCCGWVSSARSTRCRGVSRDPELTSCGPP
jgi:putative acyl-CoA dehydrogenase